jgi:acylphosphatase
MEVDMVAKRVLYTGRVQGVGFRYTAKRLSEQYPVAGFVRNLANGQVELVAEGADKDVAAFLDAVAAALAGYIEEQSVQEQATTGCTAFTIRR